jgi:hypothetical protein
VVPMPFVATNWK